MTTANNTDMSMMWTTFCNFALLVITRTILLVKDGMNLLLTDPSYTPHILVASFVLFSWFLYLSCSCWSEWSRLKRSEQELEDALAETEEELEYERQISAEAAHHLEKEKYRSEAFRKVRDQIGSDSQAWPVIVTNEVLALRNELNEIRKRQIG